MVVLFEDPRTLPLAIFLVQVFLTLVVCKIFARLLAFIRQPQVIGQIITGILFGPSILGQIDAWSATIWPPSSLPTFQLVANLGLIFFMFFLGLELDLGQIKQNWKITIPIACSSIIIPVGIGCAVAVWFYDMNDGISTSKIAFILFIASGFGFSAFPVLATLLNTMNLLNEPIGIQAISLAAVEDIVVWVILAIASAFASGDTALKGLYTLLLTLAFILIMFLIIRPILHWIHRFYLRRNNDTNVYLIVLCFLLLLVSAFTTEVMGVHAFFGAFISGLCLPRRGELIHFLGVRIELIVVEFFLPLYFANSGLNTHLEQLNHGRDWWILLVLILTASTAKIVPVTCTSKIFTKKSWHYCLSLGVLMNTRGIVQLVVLNIGVELNVLSKVIFAIFVLMATILTFLTSPVLYLLSRKEINPEKLAMDTIVEDLELARKQSHSDLAVISNLEQSYDTSLTVDERLNYPQVDPNISSEQPAVIGNIVTIPVCPPRPVNMTRF